MGKLVLYLLKEQNAKPDTVRLRRLSHQSIILKPKAQFDHMLETLAWERDMDLSAPKVLSASSQNINLGSTQNTQDLSCPTPPPPQFIIGEYPTPSSIPQTIRNEPKLMPRSEFSELRSRPSFVNFEDFEVLRQKRSNTPIRRLSMMPVDADGYRDLLIDMREDYRPRKKFVPFISKGTSNTSIKSKTTETSFC